MLGRSVERRVFPWHVAARIFMRRTRALMLEGRKHPPRRSLDDLNDLQGRGFDDHTLVVDNRVCIFRIGNWYHDNGLRQRLPDAIAAVEIANWLAFT